MKKYYNDQTIRHYTDPIIKKCIIYVPLSCKPVHITIIGFCIGMLGCIAVYNSMFMLALVAIIVNRICDALDGILARYRKQVSTAGAFLDIVLDFILYASVPIAFAFKNPTENAITVVLLLFSFMVTGTTFLAFAVFAKEYAMKSSIYTKKSMYYMSGLVEGTETCIFLVLILLFPNFFVIIGSVFVCMCLFTGIMRIYSGYAMLRSLE